MKIESMTFPLHPSLPRQRSCWPADFARTIQRNSKPGSRNAFWSNVKVREQPSLVPSAAMTASANKFCFSLSAIMVLKTSCSFFHHEHIGLKHALDSRRDFIGASAVGTVEHRDGLDHRHDAIKAPSTDKGGAHRTFSPRQHCATRHRFLPHSATCYARSMGEPASEIAHVRRFGR
jgi:hypothetical protein